MRRFILFLLLLAILIVLGAPALVGVGVERYYPELAAQLDGRIDGRRVQGLAVDQGWFASGVRFELAAPDRPAWQYRSRLVHGPLDSWPPGLLSASGRMESTGASLAEIQYKVELDGDVAGTLRPAEGVGSGSMAFHVSEGSGRTRMQLRDLTFAPLASGLAGEVVIDDADTAHARWTADLTAARLQPDPDISVDQLELDVDAARNGDDLRLSLGVNAATIDAIGRSARDLRLSLKLDKVHLPTVVHLSNALQQIDPSNLDGLRSTLVTSLGPLLYHQPRLDALELTTETSLGPLELRGEGKLLERPPPGFVTNFALLARVLDLQLAGSFDQRYAQEWARREVTSTYGTLVDAALARELEAGMVQNLEANGVLVPEGDRYRFELHYTPGRLVLNGQAMSLPDDWLAGG